MNILRTWKGILIIVGAAIALALFGCGDSNPGVTVDVQALQAAYVEDLDGIQVPIPQKGFVELWASYCKPCLEDLKYLQQASAEHGITVLAVDIREDKSLIQKTLEKNGLVKDGVPTIPVAIDVNLEVGRAIHFNAIPRTVYLDGQGGYRFFFSLDEIRQFIESGG